MAGNVRIELALQNLRKELQAAYDEGYRDGIQAARESVLKSLEQPLVTTGPPSAPVKMTLNVEGGRLTPVPTENEPRTKAPRGLLASILADILANGRGLTQAEIEKEVAIRDHRVAVKSVYNQLNYDPKYIKRDGRWFLKQSAEAPSPDASADIFS